MISDFTLLGCSQAAEDGLVHSFVIRYNPRDQRSSNLALKKLLEWGNTILRAEPKLYEGLIDVMDEEYRRHHPGRKQ